MIELIAAIASGLVFGVGLAVSGMMNPAKVIGFLDVTGNWDPSLALVLAGATGLTSLTFSFILKRQRPVLCSKFSVPTTANVDYVLVVGAALFGIGWGLAGLCPGPAYTALLLGQWESYVFFVAMVAGIAAYKFGSEYAGGYRSRGGAAA